MADPKQIADALAQDQLLAQFNRNEAQAQPWYMKPIDMEGRATFLPFKDTLPGSVMNQRELALPGLLAGAVNAFSAPGRVSTQGFDAPEEAQNLAMNVMGGGITTGKMMQNPTGVGGKDVGMFIGKSAKTWDEYAPQLTGLDQLPRQEISDKLAKLSGNKNYEDTVMDTYRAMTSAGLKKPDEEVYLKDVFNHPELFKAYPEIADYKMRILDPSLAVRGRKGSDNTISVRADLTQDEAKSTILHELQHHIQENEGFARGGSWKDFYKDLAQKHKHYDDAITRINTEMKKSGDTPKYYELMNEREDLIKEANSAGVLLPEQVKRTSEQKYKRLAGEAEARLTQARQNMTKEEMAAQNPYDPAYFLKSTETPISDLIYKGNRKKLLQQEFDKLDK